MVSITLSKNVLIVVKFGFYILDVLIPDVEKGPQRKIYIMVFSKIIKSLLMGILLLFQKIRKKTNMIALLYKKV
jgi:hypothetical protein